MREKKKKKIKILIASKMRMGFRLISEGAPSAGPNATYGRASGGCVWAERERGRRLTGTALIFGRGADLGAGPACVLWTWPGLCPCEFGILSQKGESRHGARSEGTGREWRLCEQAARITVGKRQGCRAPAQIFQREDL